MATDMPHRLHLQTRKKPRKSIRPIKRRGAPLVRLYGERTFCYGTEMVATEGKGWRLFRGLFVLALAICCAAETYARQTAPAPQQTPAQRTGRSYDTAARRAAPPAPQS